MAERAKRARAQTFDDIRNKWLAPALAGFVAGFPADLGFRFAPPRLYASTRSAGSIQIGQLNSWEPGPIDQRQPSTPYPPFSRSGSSCPLPLSAASSAFWGPSSSE